MLTIKLDNAQLDLLIEALNYRAGRHESMSRFNPQGAGPHDRIALKMRKLVAHISALRAKVPA